MSRRKGYRRKRYANATKAYVKSVVSAATQGLLFRLNDNYANATSNTFTSESTTDFTATLHSATQDPNTSNSQVIVLKDFQNTIKLQLDSTVGTSRLVRVIWFLWYQKTVPTPGDILMGANATEWVYAPWRPKEEFDGSSSVTLSFMGRRYFILKDYKTVLVPNMVPTAAVPSNPYKAAEQFVSCYKKNINQKVYIGTNQNEYWGPGLFRFIISDNVTPALAIESYEFWQMTAMGR